jgi:hypothetical protein
MSGHGFSFSITSVRKTASLVAAAGRIIYADYKTAERIFTRFY